MTIAGNKIKFKKWKEFYVLRMARIFVDINEEARLKELRISAPDLGKFATRRIAVDSNIMAVDVTAR